MTQLLVPVDARTADWPRKVANAVNSLILTANAAGGTAAWGSITGTLSDQTDLSTSLSGKQAALVSGTNIKTVNSTSLLGSGNVSVGTVTSVDASGGTTGFAFTGGPVTTSGTLTLTVSNASTARTALGVAIGTDVQAYSANLSALAALSTTGKIFYLSAANTWTAVTIGSGLTFSGGTLDTAGGSGVTTTGSPASGNLAKFSGSATITNGDLSGDVTTSGSLVATLANSGVTAATYGDSTHVAQVTVDAKGRVTGASSVAITGPAFRGALVTKSADQTGANYSGAPMIAWNSEVYDTDSIHDNVTNNTRLTVPSGVSYVKVAAAVDLSSVTASSDCALVIQKNGGNATGTTRLRLNSSATVPALYVASPVLAVTAGDYFEAQLFCSDTSITVTISEGSSWFSMEIIG